MNTVKIMTTLVVAMVSGIIVFASFTTESIVTYENNLPSAYIYERLIPNTLYMEWCSTISSNMPSSDLCITPRGSKSEFVTDANGIATVSLEAGAFLSQDDSTYFEVAISHRGVESPTWFLLSPTHNNLFGDDQATLKLEFEGLVSDADYSLWCVAITHSPNSEIHEQSCS